MIKAINISKRFEQIIALDNITFNLKQGKLVALVGENGAGKSTLMRILSGYISADEGKVEIFNHNLKKERISALSCIGYVPEISALYGDMIVYDFLYWIAKIWNISNIDDTIIKISKQMKIMEVLQQKNDTLSKGFKKRVEIASAILHSPRLLILDEPTDGLDPNQKREIRKFIKQYAKNNIVLVSTHVLEDADIADNILMLSHGKLIFNDTLDSFKKITSTGDLRDAFHILSKKESL